MKGFDFVLYKIIYYGIYFSAFIPLIIFRGFVSPTNFGKGIVFHVLVEVVFVLYVYLAIKYREFRPRFRTPILFAFTLFVASYALSSFIGIDWRSSLWGSWERMGGLFSMLHYLAFFVVLINILKTEEDWKNLFRFSIFVAFLTVIYSFIQMSNIKFFIAPGGSRVFSTLGNPSMFAGYLLFNFYFTLFLLMQKYTDLRACLPARQGSTSGFARKPEVIFYSVFIMLSLIALFLTQSRGALLGLGLTLFVLLSILAFQLFKNRKLKFLYRYGLAIFLVIVILAGLLIYVNRDSELVRSVPTVDKFVNFSVRDDPLRVSTIDSRLMVWGGTLEAIKNKPVFGWGPENFVVPFLTFYNPNLFVSPTSELYFDRPHNTFLEIASFQGLIGLAAYIFLLYVILKATRSYILRALLASYIIYGFFFFDTITTYLMLIFFMGFVASKKVSSNEDHYRVRFRGLQMRPLYIMIFLVVVAGFLIYKTSVLPVKANAGSVKALSDLGKGNYGEAVARMRLISNYSFIDHSRIEALFEFLPYYLDNLERFKKITNSETVEEDLLFFIGMLEKEAKGNKNHILQLYMSNAYKRYAMLYDQTYFSRSEAILTRLTDKYPTMPLFYLELGDIKSWQRDNESALSYFGKAYSLKENNYYLKFEFAKRKILYGQAGGFDLAIEAAHLHEGYRNLKDVIELAGRLQQAGRIDDAVDLLEFIYREDLRPDFGVFLAKLYIDTDDFEKAREVANNILDSDIDHSLDINTYQRLVELFIILDDPNRRFEAETRAGLGTIQLEMIK